MGHQDKTDGFCEARVWRAEFTWYKWLTKLHTTARLKLGILDWHKKYANNYSVHRNMFNKYSHAMYTHSPKISQKASWKKYISDSISAKTRQSNMLEKNSRKWRVPCKGIMLVIHKNWTQTSPL